MFEIDEKDIKALNDEELRDLIGMLCEAEFMSRGLDTSGVTYGGDQNAKDGGVDVRVQYADFANNQSYIPRANCVIQVKKPKMPPAAITKEMCDEEKLKESISNVLKNDGAYIIVSSGDSTSDSALKNRIEAMEKVVLTSMDTANLKVDFYDSKRIASWVRQHSGVSLWIRNKVNKNFSGWRSFDKWFVDKRYITDESIRIIDNHRNNLDDVSILEGIDLIRQELVNGKGSVRLVGLSGVGKTRLVQALFDEELGKTPLNKYTCHYTDMEFNPIPSPVTYAEKLMEDEKKSILIVDNCSPHLHRHLSKVLKKSFDKVSLLTIEYDVRDDLPEETSVFKLEPASENALMKILAINCPNLNQDSIIRISEISGGNSRIALALANAIGIDENISELKDQELFSRLFYQRDEKDKKLLEIGEACSLVYSFDGEDTTDESELAFVSNLSATDMRETYRGINELHKRDLIQKRDNWRALLPHALANRLASQALDSIHPLMINNELLKKSSQRLILSFARRVSYLPNNTNAKKIVSQWFENGGVLEDLSTLNKHKINILLNIVYLCPDKIVEKIDEFDKENINSKSIYFTDLRHEVSELLCSLAYYSRYFEISILELFKLELVNTDSLNDNNKKLYSLFQISNSRTDTRVESRLAVVNNLLYSGELVREQMAIKLIEKMLLVDRFELIRMSNDYGNGKYIGYVPKDRIEYESWYHYVLDYLVEQVDSNPKIREKLINIIASTFNGLWIKLKIHDKLISITESLHKKYDLSSLLIAIRRTLKYSEKHEEASLTEKLRWLEIFLEPNDLLSEINLFTLTSNGFGRVFVNSNKKMSDDEIGKYVDERVVNLGEELADNFEALDENYICRLLSNNNPRLLMLGQGVARNKKNWRVVLDRLMCSASKIFGDELGINFIIGFLMEMQSLDINCFEKAMDRCFDNKSLDKVFLLVQCNLKVSELGYKRVLSYLKCHTIDKNAFSNFPYSTYNKKLSDEQVIYIYKDLLKNEENCYLIMNALYNRVTFTNKKPYSNILRNFALDLLSSINLISDRYNSESDNYILGEVTKEIYTFVDEKRAFKICNNMFRKMNENRIFLSDVSTLMRTLAHSTPNIYLECFFNNNGFNNDELSIYYKDINDSYTIIDLVDQGLLRQWCREQDKSIYEKLPKFIIPYVYDAENGTYSWKEIVIDIIKHVDREDIDQILEEIFKSFYITSWSGSKADIMEDFLPLFEDLIELVSIEFKLIITEKKTLFLENIKSERCYEIKRNEVKYTSFEELY